MKRPERSSGVGGGRPVAKAPVAAGADDRAAPAPVPRTRVGRERPVRDSAPRRTARSDRAVRRADRLRRRYENAEVRRFTRRARRRRIGWLVVTTVVAIVGVLIAVAVFSPILALREVRVEGATRVDPAAVADAVSGQLGTPLALLDDERIRGELGQFASIRSFSTELAPPGTLIIHIVERTPIGLVATPTGFEVVDAAGVVLESSPTRPDVLPLLQLDADGVAGRGFAAMAAVLVALPPEVLAQVDSITARTRDDVTLVLAGSDQRVVWGSASDSDRKARILAALLARFAASGPGEYDVSAPGSAVFRAG